MDSDRRGHRAAGGELDFWRHVEDLRKALFRAVLGWLAGTVVAWEFWEDLWKLLLRPLQGMQPAPRIVVTSPTGAVNMSMQVALVAGSVAAAPWMFWQFWGFIRPALRDRERGVVLSAIRWTTGLFVVGLVAGYFTIFPMTLRWLAGYGRGMFEQMWTVDEYTSMSVKLLGGFALTFEFPLVAWTLARLGVADHRSFLRWSRGAIVAIFVVAAVVTPPDPVSQCMMAVPMVALYFTGVAAAWWGRKGRA
jgi:sec-independent protein translocase protein TatC